MEERGERGERRWREKSGCRKERKNRMSGYRREERNLQQRAGDVEERKRREEDRERGRGTRGA